MAEKTRAKQTTAMFGEVKVRRGEVMVRRLIVVISNLEETTKIDHGKRERQRD